MKRIIDKMTFHFNRILFENFGIPKVKSENISKIYIKKFLPKNPIVIECGAHDGADTVQLHKVLNGEVFCFEPVEEIFIRLQERTKGNPNIHCFKIALSNSSGEQKFFVSEGGSDGSSSLLKPKDHLIDHPDTFFNDQIVVNALTLDDWAEKNGIKKVDFLWLDMQGFELQMLEASEKILPTVKAIHTEVSVKETYEGVLTYNTYKAFLESKGFKVVIEAIPEGWDMGNVLFVR